MFIYCHIDNEKLKIQKNQKILKKILKKKILKKLKKRKKIESRISFHFMTFHFTTCHSYLMSHDEMLFSRLYPRIKNR